MNRLPAQLAEGNEDRMREFRAALEAVLSSRAFESRARLREFLQFVGKAALEGRAAEIKEQAVGVEVFGRPPDYPVHDDTIVRVTARQLRQKLEEYYQTEGKDAAWVIEIPRGTYVPVFRERALAETPALPPEPEGFPVPASSAAMEPSPPAGKAKPLGRFSWGGWMVALVLCAVALFLVLWKAPFAEERPPATLLSLMQTAPGQRVSVVCGDAVVQIYKDLVGDAPSVPEYENGSYLKHPALLASVAKDSRLWESVHTRQLVATGSVQALSRLVRAIPEGHLSVRHPREVGVRDFVDDNVILLSGPFANPWVQLFEPKLNFRVVQDARKTVYVQNTSPAPGESAEYRNHEEGPKRINYARLAYLPNLGGKGRILLIGGPSAPLMELIGSAVSSPQFLRQLADRLGAEESGSLPYCEMLLEVEEIAGAPVRTRIVAARRVTAKPEGLP
jgi:hypothetical protein